MRHGALSRFTILDATRVRAGPTAVRLFADMGARVIKLEIPRRRPRRRRHDRRARSQPRRL